MTKAFIIAAAGALFLAGCSGEQGDMTADRQTIDPSGNLQDMRAGIWYSPQGCQYWIIDDGVEGYLTPRYNPQTGKPVCVNVPSDFPGLATGDFKQGATSVIGDPI
jgi:hypothetical protein